LVNTIYISSKYQTTKQHPVFGGAQDKVKSFVLYELGKTHSYDLLIPIFFSLAKLLWGQIGIVVLNQYACWVTDQFLKFNYFPQFPNSELFFAICSQGYDLENTAMSLIKSQIRLLSYPHPFPLPTTKFITTRLLQV
jgi:hypothetical protein